MKKFLIFAFLGAMVTFGASADNFVVGKSQECWYDNAYNNTKQWAFWFCGAQKASCSGKHKNGDDIGTFLNDGQSFTNRGRTFFCCGGTDAKQGIFKEGELVTETVTKQLSGGATCNYTVVTDPCGKVVTGDCNIPDSCPAGRTLRNSECVAQCPDGQAFESAASNKCVESKTTSSGGTQTVTAEDTDLINAGANIGDKVNRRCDEAIEIWDSNKEECVKKSDSQKVKQISANTMEKCYACTSNEYFRACLDCAVNNSCTDSKMKKACLLK